MEPTSFITAITHLADYRGLSIEEIQQLLWQDEAAARFAISQYLFKTSQEQVQVSSAR